MWTYEVISGRLLAEDGSTAGFGYSGYDDGDGIPEPGEGKNDPSKEAQRSVGPIPEGMWSFGPPFFHETAGPYVLRLHPQPGTDTHGRDGFLIHGDSMKGPGTASRGCIVLPRFLRRRLWESDDHEIMVISGNAVPRDIA